MSASEYQFPDDLLRRLKESLDTCDDEQQQCYRVKEFRALIARLETSERTIVNLLIICDSEENKETIMEATLPWRQVRGV